MAIRFHPSPGSILICDFKGMIMPEMQKRRPVIVISPRYRRQPSGLCTVVPLSTTPPSPQELFHTKLYIDPPMPKPYDSEYHWVKADMIYRVSFDRLHLFHNGKTPDGKRQYIYPELTEKQLEEVRQCVKHALGFC